MAYRSVACREASPQELRASTPQRLGELRVGKVTLTDDIGNRSRRLIRLPFLVCIVWVLVFLIFWTLC